MRPSRQWRHSLSAKTVARTKMATAMMAGRTAWFVKTELELDEGAAGRGSVVVVPVETVVSPAVRAANSGCTERAFMSSVI